MPRTMMAQCKKDENTTLYFLTGYRYDYIFDRIEFQLRINLTDLVQKVLALVVKVLNFFNPKISDLKKGFSVLSVCKG